METLSPHCIVEIENRRFDSRRGKDLIASSVDLTTDKSGEGSVQLYDPGFQIIDALLGGGAPFALKAQFRYGWKTDLGSPLFEGTLARVEWSDSITTFRFQDGSAKMKKEKKTRYFKKKTDLQILKKLAEDNGLKFSSKTRTKESQPIDSLMQAGKTDWETALKIAARSGLKLYVSGDTLFAVEAGTTLLENPVAVLNFEKDFTLLRGFNLSYKLPDNKRSRSIKTQVRTRGTGDRQLKGEANLTASGDTVDIIIGQDLPKQTVEMAAALAKGKRDRKREYAFEHQLKLLSSFQKITSLRNTVTLAGMGKFFSGNYIVTQIRYDFRPGELTTEMTVGADLK